MDVEEVLRKYSRKIEEEMKSSDVVRFGDSGVSKEYAKFKTEFMPELSRYEKYARIFGNIIKVNLASKDEQRISKQLEIAHLNVTPSEAFGLALISFLFLFFTGIFVGLILWFFGYEFPLLLVSFLIIASFFVFYYFYTFPSRLAIKWKLKAGSQMVPAILYTVIYMKHTSNLERAISFVSQHIDPPLALDLKKVIWDVETGRYSSIKESLDYYLDFWKESNMEFVESFHLIESSLYEPSETRRIQILERALRVILDGVYEKMLNYTHSVKAPLTNLYMLGIVLPTLGLALLPLASTLLGGMIRPLHVFILFNILIPFFVFYLTLQIMLKRPGGYGETTLLENNPNYNKYISKKPYIIALLVCLPLLIIGLLPFIFQIKYFTDFFGLKSDYSFSELGLDFLGNGNIFSFQDNDGEITGPFGFGALILSLFIPLSVSLFFSLSYFLKTKDLIKSREETVLLENEFNSSLFSLGNRLGDGFPAEIAFSKVANSVKGQRTEDFFKIVNTNIQSMGMGIEEAIFNPKRGALVYYPSNLIATSMRILVESVKKGLNVAAESLMSISDYVRNMQKINERLKDLLADVVSDMKSNMTFLAPLLAGVVVGLSSMITDILGQLKNMADFGGGDVSIAGLANINTIIQLFDIRYMIPPYFMQISIGIYIIQVVFVLTSTLVTVDSGEDKLKQTYETSRNLLRGSLLYLVIALLSIMALSTLSRVALGGLV